MEWTQNSLPGLSLKKCAFLMAQKCAGVVVGHKLFYGAEKQCWMRWRRGEFAGFRGLAQFHVKFGNCRLAIPASPRAGVSRNNRYRFLP